MLIHATQPMLCLRGGGADKKRKEARKRKFETLQGNETAEISEDQGLRKPGVQAGPIAKRLRKQALSSPLDDEASPTLETNFEETEAAKDVVANNHNSQQTTQRFIVFIGMVLHI